MKKFYIRKINMKKFYIKNFIQLIKKKKKKTLY